ncbi:uncharacterized protein G2W53_039759 [Senna tora]|uniref:Uncharacterized protein n=1 Tax=Senna tora TaxID=362788 RepID=A0A834SR29_9FABA|nr:uncharacterized protein G2W53_039759 [Senna tora]
MVSCPNELCARTKGLISLTSFVLIWDGWFALRGLCLQQMAGFPCLYELSAQTKCLVALTSFVLKRNSYVMICAQLDGLVALTRNGLLPLLVLCSYEMLPYEDTKWLVALVRFMFKRNEGLVSLTSFALLWDGCFVLKRNSYGMICAQLEGLVAVTRNGLLPFHVFCLYGMLKCYAEHPLTVLNAQDELVQCKMI